MSTCRHVRKFAHAHRHMSPLQVLHLSALNVSTWCAGAVTQAAASSIKDLQPPVNNVCITFAACCAQLKALRLATKARGQELRTKKAEMERFKGIVDKAKANFE